MNRSFLKSRHSLIAAAAIAAIGSMNAQAANINWVGPNASFWDLAANWNPASPGAADDVLLGAFDTVFRTQSGVLTTRSFNGTGLFSVTGGTLNFTNASSVGSFAMSGGQLGGTGNLTVTGAATLSVAAMSGNGTSTFQGATTISSTGLWLDGGRVFRNEGTVTQSGGIDMNRRRSGADEAGNGGALNAVGGTWNSSIAAGTNSISTSIQGVGDTGAGATFTNAGTFNKLGAGTTNVRTSFVNTGSLNVQAGQLQFGLDGALTHSGTLTVAGGAVLDFAGRNTDTHTINTAATTIAGTLSITGDNVLNFTAPHTIGGTGTFQQNVGQVTGADLTLGPQLAVNITLGGHSGAATTTVQGTTTISGTGLLLDGGRIFRNEGTVTQSGGIDMNRRRSGADEAGNGSVLNAAGGTWNSSIAAGTNSISTSIQGVGDTGAGATFTNAGTFNKQGAGTTAVRVALNNSGLVDVQAGTLTFVNGGVLQGSTGTLQIGAAGIVALDAATANTTGNLFHNGSAANSLQLSTGTITVHTDYNNANFGVGNAFNRRANVTVVAGGPAARLLAAGDANQGLSGAGLSNGNTAAPSIVVGNVHVGATTFTYNINNTGTSGPVLRGAIQDAANGGNITDARLSGNGVLSSNWGPLAAGASTSRDITITIGAAGVFAPITGQAVSIVNNFENTRSQLLTISSGAGAAAYNLAAAAAVTPNPVNLGNQRVGGTASAALTIANIAPSGSFSEALNASFAGTSGSALTNGGTVNLLAAGASNNSAMTVRLDGSTAGAKTGGAQINFASDGSGTSGLGLTALGGQVINISGSFYNAAVGSTTPTPVTLANQRVGGSGSQVLSVANTAAAGAFSEALNASFSASTGAATTNGGSVVNLVAGGTNAAAMSVGVNTATAGAKAGSVTLAYQTDGTGPNGNSGLAAIGAGSQLINVSGNVYNMAVGSATPTPVVLANQRVGGGASQLLTVSNTAAAGAFSEALNASFSAASGAATNNGGSVLNLIAGGNNGTAMSVGVNTATAGAQSGTVTLAYQSDGTGPNSNSGLAAIAAGSQTITVNGNVYQAASGAIQTAALNFGTVQVGQVVSQNLVIRNTAVGAAGFVEDLNASFGSSNGTGSGLISGSGSLSGILAGTNSSGANGTMTVAVNTAAAGVVSGGIAVNYSTAGAVGGVSNGLGTAAVGSENYGVAGTIEAMANVINQASPLVNNPTVNLGAVRVGAAAPGATVSVTNLATVAPQAALNASIAPTSGPVTASGSFNLLNPGATNNASLVVGMNTATAGNFTGANAGAATISFVSDASNVGNCAPNCTLNLASQNVNVEGKVYAVASGQLATNSVDFGVVRVGDTVSARNITINNTAAVAGLNDTLQASLTGVAGPFSGNGSVSGIAAQGSGTLAVGLNTASAGLFSFSGTVGFSSQNADMADVSGGADASLALMAQVNNLADGDFDLLSAFGTLTQTGTSYLLDLGNVNLGDNVAAVLRLANAVAGPADDLSGAFDLTAADDFSYGGWNPFANLAAGQGVAGLSVNWLASAAGLFTDTIFFSGLGTNASDTMGLAQSRQLTIRANVIQDGGGNVPEPGTLWLLLAGALAANAAAARRRRSMH